MINQTTTKQLSKGDQLWLVSRYGLHKATVKRVYKYKSIVTFDTNKEIELRTTSEYGEEVVRWIEYGRCSYSYLGDSGGVAFELENLELARILYENRRIESKRYELHEWVRNSAPIPALKMILGVKRRFEVKKG